jgi:hypothetical protein
LRRRDREWERAPGRAGVIGAVDAVLDDEDLQLEGE